MIHRRLLLRLLPLGAGMALHLPTRAQDALLQDQDSEAGAIDYHADAGRVDRQRFPRYAAGQRCANCTLYTAAPGSDQGACALVYGKGVSAAGWCSSWQGPPA